MAIIRSYTVYFYSKSGSCILYFGIDGTSKKQVLKLGRSMANLLQDHYKPMFWGTKITVKVEEYKANKN